MVGEELQGHQTTQSAERLGNLGHGQGGGTPFQRIVTDDHIRGPYLIDQLGQDPVLVFGPLVPADCVRFSLRAC